VNNLFLFNFLGPPASSAEVMIFRVMHYIRVSIFFLSQNGSNGYQKTQKFTENSKITSYFKITGSLTEKTPKVPNLHINFQITF
jgi:hypothetical protein